ncbi:hypothetical protein [Lactococcus lactis]|nr:hypothetical protein [Lactococcus lactis]
MKKSSCCDICGKLTDELESHSIIGKMLVCLTCKKFALDIKTVKG